MPDDKREMCAWNYKHDYPRYATHILRISCPNHPDECETFKVISICDLCVDFVQRRIDRESGLTCAKCQLNASAGQFWAVLGKVSVQ